MTAQAATTTRRQASSQPRIVEQPSVKVATVTITGGLRLPPTRALRALYASVGAVRAAHLACGASFEIGPLRARFPDAQSGSISQWRWVLAVSVPENTVSVPQMDPDHPVSIEVWVYDQVAELLHEGTEETKPVTVQRLVEFIIAQGYRPIGPREEIYIGTGPLGGRTLLRYPVIPVRQARESSVRTARASRSISSL